MTGGGLRRHGVVRGYRSPDIAEGVLSDPNSMLVGVPTFSARAVSLVVDATVVAATPTLGLVYVFPLVDPAGAVVSAFPWLPPDLFLDIPAVAAPTGASGVAVVVGILDGVDVTADQYICGGPYYGATGILARTISHDPITTDSGAAVASAIYAEVDVCSTSSFSTVDAVGVRRVICKLSADLAGGGGGAIQGAPNDEYAKAPHLFFAVLSDGTSLDAAMPITFGWRYQSTFKQTVLGG